MYKFKLNMYFFLKISFTLILSNFLGSFFLHASDEARPTAFFRLMFWGEQKIESLYYAPWGNFEESNSTQFSTSVRYGALSKKCAYYGQNDIILYKELTPDSHDQRKKDRYKKISRISFVAREGETKEFIVLISSPNQLGEYQCFQLPFTENDVPWGSYKLFSQIRETLYIAAENKKFALQPGGNESIHSSEFEEARRIRLKIYQKKNQEYKQVSSSSLAMNSKRRGVCLLTTMRKKIYLIPLIDDLTPLSKIVGYGCGPLVLAPEPHAKTAKQ